MTKRKSSRSRPEAADAHGPVADQAGQGDLPERPGQEAASDPTRRKTWHEIFEEKRAKARAIGTNVYVDHKGDLVPNKKPGKSSQQAYYARTGMKKPTNQSRPKGGGRRSK